MKSDPLAISRWWRALRISYHGNPHCVVLRCHNFGSAFEVRVADLDALLPLIESGGPPGAASHPTNQPGNPEKESQ